jgi:hypothetical protein
LLAAIACGGCRTTREVASTTTQVVTAPARYVAREMRGEPEQTTETTTVYEGVPVSPPPPPPPPTTMQPRERERTTTAVTESAAPPAPPSRPSATPHAITSSTAAPQFPVAKPVPGKPGFVYSPFDGAMIDVRDFPAGSKAKDPGTNKIFIVP